MSFFNDTVYINTYSLTLWIIMRYCMGLP